MIEEGMGAYANPESMLRAEVLLLRHICRADAANKLEKALDSCPIHASKGKVSCQEYTAELLKSI